MTRPLRVDTAGVTASPTMRSAPAGVRMTRENLLSLERSGGRWRFIPLAFQALEQCPEDAELRLTLVAALARLGLNTLALEQFDALPAKERETGDLPQLRAVLAESAGREKISARRAIRTAERNVAALADRGVDVSDALQRFRARVDNVERFQAEDGNVVRRWRGRAGFAAFERVADEKGATSAFALPHLDIHGKPKPVADVRPYVVHGVDPPWLVQRVWRKSPPGADGHQPWIIVFSSDTDALLDGLALTDLRRVIADPRVHFLVGEQAGDALAQFLDAHNSATLQCVLLEPPSARHRAEPPPERIIDSALKRQQAEGAALRERMSAAYAGRDRAWWARRYAAALGEMKADDEMDATPLRVLIPTCRYSTYIQHSAADLAEALQSLGCETHVLIEPDDFTRLTQLAYLREFVDWRPDLVALINYTREHLRDAMPGNLPFVCWIQDRMPHLFSASLGAAQGELDFIIGHTYRELFSQFGWPRARARLHPVAVSTRKFHAAPVEASLCERFECDIAYISHQSESPEAMQARLASALGEDARLHRMLSDAYAFLQRALESNAIIPVHRLVAESLRRARCEHDPEGRFDGAQLETVYALPLLERMARHRALRWAADVADEESLRLRIYGNGWERHPRFAAYAQGAVDHGEALRAAYQCARCHLHISATTNAHQRVFECAMSGGVALRQVVWTNLHVAEATLVKRKARLAAAERQISLDVLDPLDFILTVDDERDPDAAKLSRLWKALDASPTLPQVFAWDEAVERRAQRNGGVETDSEGSFQAHMRDLRRQWLRDFMEVDLSGLPDLSLPGALETLFHDKESLRRCILRAVRDDAWRAQTIRDQSAFASQRFGLPSFARELLNMVQRSLAAPAEAKG